MKSLNFFASALVLTGSVFLSSCGEDDPATPLQATTISNLAADPPTGFNPTTGQPIGTTGKFKFFSFSTGAAVANSDSATSKWDLGFRGTTIIVNSGTSGPGSAAAQVFTGIFDETVLAPDDGYKTDNKTATPPYAIPTGSGNGWYNATATQPTVITPIAGRIIIVKTADGKYAKIEILSYYKDAPAAPTGNEPARYYSFRYIYQPDGSKNLE